MLFLAVDFGTSSTLAAFIDGIVLKFVDFGEGKYTTETVLRFPQKQRMGQKAYLIGHEAIREYQEEGGRLMFSIKSLLGEKNFTSTIVPGFGACSAGQLCGLFLAKVKLLAEKQFGKEFQGVVLGRPADFSKDAIAELRNAGHLAGFRKVVFVPEPIAAGIKYFEENNGTPETVFVIDAGGGTTDFAVLQNKGKIKVLSLLQSLLICLSQRFHDLFKI